MPGLLSNENFSKNLKVDRLRIQGSYVVYKYLR